MRHLTVKNSAASLDIYPNSLCKYYRQQVFYMYVEIGKVHPGGSQFDIVSQSKQANVCRDLDFGPFYRSSVSTFVKSGMWN